MTQLLHLEQLTTGYGTRSVCTGITLSVCQGERWFFLGQNGAGKSTLLKTVLGRIRPLRGAVHLQVPAKELGIVPQLSEVSRLLPTTVREFVSLGLNGLSLRREEQVERYRWALERCGLAAVERRDYWSLSGGQRQRALLARALVRRPKLLVLDEPTEGLDYSARDEFLQVVTELGCDGDRCGVIFVTHDLELAHLYASHIALLHHGQCYVTCPGGAPLPHSLPAVYRSVPSW